MKIMMIYDLAPPHMGGVESYLIQLGRHLTKLGHEVHWLTSKIPNTTEYENYEGIHIHRIPILFRKSFLFPGRQSFAFTSLIQKLDFIKDMDIVHANTLVAGYSGWRIARKYNKPSLLFCHEFYRDLWKVVGQNRLEKKIYPKMEEKIARAPYDWYACPSEYSKSTLIDAGAPERRITVIPHGVNRDLYNTDVDKTYFRRKFGLENFKLFGFLGRLKIKQTAQAKNLRMLLEATKIVTKQIPDARLVLAGAGYEEMEPMVKKMELEKNVTCLGNIAYEDNANFLTMCDVVVCPALSDGFCFLLAEASACGRPLVATKLGAHTERIVHGESGLLAEPTAESIASSIVQILLDEQILKRFGENGKNYAAHFTWEESVKKHIEIYEMLLSRN